MSEIPLDEHAHETCEITPELSHKAWGMMWNVNDDVFYYVSKLQDDQVKPAGMLKCPHFVRQLEKNGCKLGMTYINFDRCVVPNGFQEAAMELHHFCDASLSGYGACSFLRLTNRNGPIHTAFMMAKSRLAPVKQIIVPRLELCAAVVVVKLDNVIRGELEMGLLPLTFWPDSPIVLSYIRNESKRFKIFEGNRVSLIHENTTSEQWQYIPGNLKPSDVASRSSNEPITVTEIRHAETVVIKHVQNTSFACKIRSSTRGKNVSKSSAIRALNPILFADILVAAGRIRHAPLCKDLRYPFMLPSKHKLYNMILLEYHNCAPLGTEWTLRFV